MRYTQTAMKSMTSVRGITEISFRILVTNLIATLSLVVESNVTVPGFKLVAMGLILVIFSFDADLVPLSLFSSSVFDLASSFE